MPELTVSREHEKEWRIRTRKQGMDMKSLLQTTSQSNDATGAGESAEDKMERNSYAGCRREPQSARRINGRSYCRCKNGPQSNRRIEHRNGYSIEKVVGDDAKDNRPPEAEARRGTGTIHPGLHPVAETDHQKTRKGGK